ncbi:MAG: tetratricopeptide repeat protein [Pseudomonadota bacterium]|nr:tetratricopeptide repeat protein [Pseudomonadota bacterium]
MAEAEIARLARRVREEPRSTVFVALADALRREGRFGEGLQILREGFRVHPDHAAARVVLGRIHLEMGHRSLASDVLAEVVQADPENLAAASLLARIFVEDGRMGEARPLVERLRMANHPDGALGSRVPDAGRSTEPPPRGSDPFDHPRLAARFAQAGHYHRAAALWRRLDREHPSLASIQEPLLALNRALEGQSDVPNEFPVPADAARRPLPGLADAFAALVDSTEPAEGRPPRGRHPVARYARHFWRTT